MIAGFGGNDRICGDAGNDSIEAGEGNDGLDGGDGSDFATFSTATTGVQASLFAREATGQGDDRLFRLERLSGSPFGDQLRGDDQFNELLGGEGDDSLVGDAGLDLLRGDAGDDVLDGGSNNDVAVFADSEGPVDVDLGAGSSTGNGADNILGVEAVFGSDHDDTIEGDEGDNYLFGSGGNDVITGGGGFDYAVYWRAPNGVTADLAAGTATGEGDDTLAGISGLIGSDFDDTLSGDAAANYLDGYAGNDALDGRDGDDLFVGRDGNDNFIGGEGGFDRIDFRGPNALEVSFPAGTATGEGSDSLEGIEGAGGGKKADLLEGDDGTDYFAGRGGADVALGGDGDDFMHGGAGKDRADGGAGKDACKSFEKSRKNCEKKTEPPAHPLEKSVDTTESYRRNF